MNLLVKINAVDKTSLIEWDSFAIEDNIDDQPNICQFLIKVGVGETYKPVAGDVVEAWDGATMIFSGKIARIKNNVFVDTVYYNITCRDKTSELARKQITESFSSTTVGLIIKYIVDNYYQGMGITYANVSCDIPVTKLVFNKIGGDKALTELANLTNYNWFIDYAGDIHFFAKSSLSAPYSIGEGSNIVIGDSLEFNSDVTQLRNAVMIEGGEMLSASNKTQNAVGDGVNKTFGTNYKFGLKPTVGLPATYTYRKKITITGQTGAGTSYQIPLLVGESSGSAGVNVHVASHCALFPTDKNISGDIRFRGSDGATELPFWTEKVTGTTPNRVAKIWVKVAEDLGTDKDIYIYYGGATTNVSSGPNTFLFFDDFDGVAVDVTKWTVVDATGISVASGVMTETGGAGRLLSIPTFGSGVEQLVKFKTASKTTGGLMTGGFFGSTANGIGMLNHPGTNSRYYRNDSNWVGLTGAEMPDNVDYLLSFKTFASTVAMILKNYSDLTTAQDYGTLTNTVSAEPIGLGKRYDDGPVTGGSTSWDFVIIKKVVATEPSFNAVTAEESAPSVNYTVGVDNIDKDADYQAMWNYNEKYVRFISAPALNTAIQITGKPLIPIIVQVENIASISQFGRYEFSKIDKTIASEDEAKNYAQSQLDSYAASIREGSFDTYQSGFASGQLISINLPSLNTIESFVIQKVSLRMFSQTKGVWKVDLATTKTIGIIAFLQNQLMDGKKTVELNKDQVIKKYYCDWVQVNVTEEISIKAKMNDWQDVNVGEEVLKDPFGAGVYPNFCVGPFTPTSNTDPDREFRLDLSLLS